MKNGLSKGVLLLLTFFTGGIGGHKFYLKKYWQGILYLLFFWTSLPSVIALIEFIRYAVTKEDTLREQYPEAADRNAMVLLVCIGLVWVVAFVGILAAIAIPNFIMYRNRAYVAAIDKELVKIKAAQDRYHEKYGKYTTSLAALNMYITAPNISVEIVKADKDCFRARGRNTAADLESWIDCNGPEKSEMVSTSSEETDAPGDELPPDPTVLEGTVFTPPDGGFTIVFPGKPTFTKQSLDTPIGPIGISMFMVDTLVQKRF